MLLTKFDFIFCNLMSHCVTSRCRFLRKLARDINPGGYLFYSEETEGYAPMEIHRAIQKRNRTELIARQVQVLNGFLERTGFRFFVSGTFPSLLRSYGLQVMENESFDWNGLVYSEQAIFRAASPPGPDNKCDDANYLDVDSELIAVQALYRQMVSVRKNRGFNKSKQDHIYDLASNLDYRFAPFLVFLLMADQVLPPFWPKFFSLGKLDRLSLSILTRLSSLFSLSPATWNQLENIDKYFLEIIKKPVERPLGRQP